MLVQIINQGGDIAHLRNAAAVAIRCFGNAGTRSMFKKVVDQKGDITYIEQAVAIGVSRYGIPQHELTTGVFYGDLLAIKRIQSRKSEIKWYNPIICDGIRDTMSIYSEFENGLPIGIGVNALIQRSPAFYP